MKIKLSMQFFTLVFLSAFNNYSATKYKQNSGLLEFITANKDYELAVHASKGKSSWIETIS